MKKGFCFVLVLWFAVSCKHTSAIEQIEEGNKVITLNVPKGFPYPEIPADNQPTQNRIDLGLKLFNDPILSRDSTISCASCHQADKYFTDNLFLSLGIENRRTERNSPSLLNVAYQPYMFWDGGNPTLEQQVLAPIANHLEMDFDANKVVERLQKHPNYPSLFLKAYNQQPSIFSLTRAIACFERTLFSGNSKYDQFLQTRDSSVFTLSEKNGLKLFFNEQGDCFHCHQGFNMTDNSFQNNGLYAVYLDSGRARITQRAMDIGKFKVPTLRNVEKTAPYMHDGSKQTLEDVINHYNSGGMKHPNKSAVLRPLSLSEQDKIDLINFLKTLTSK
jgi:cytochrome c peroxidase